MGEYLCIGGPLAGETMASDERAFFAPDRGKSVTTLGPVDYDSAETTTSVRRTRYVRDTMHTPSAVLRLWRPEEQSIEETVRILLATYAEYHRLKGIFGTERTEP